MDGDLIADRISGALARIEAAAGRIAAAARAHAASGPAGDPELQERYDLLRRETAEALQQLDAIIAEFEP